MTDFPQVSMDPAPPAPPVVQVEPTVRRTGQSANIFDPVITIRIKDRDYTIARLTMGAARAWRQQIEQHTAILGGALQLASQIGGHNSLNDALSAISISPIAALADAVIGLLVRSPDIVADLVYAYAPALADDRDWIEQHCYDEDIVMIFMQLVAQAWPMGKLAPLAGRLTALAAGQHGAALPGMEKK